MCFEPEYVKEEKAEGSGAAPRAGALCVAGEQPPVRDAAADRLHLQGGQLLGAAPALR